MSEAITLQDVRIPLLHEVTSPFDGSVVGAIPTTAVTAVDALLATARTGAVTATAVSGKGAK